MSDDTKKQETNKTEEQDPLEAAKSHLHPRNKANIEKELDDFEDAFEKVWDITKEALYLLTVLKDANVLPNSPEGAIIRLINDRLVALEEKASPLLDGATEETKREKQKDIIVKQWIAKEHIRGSIQSLMHSVEALVRRIELMQSNEQWYEHKIDELERMQHLEGPVSVSEGHGPAPTETEEHKDEQTKENDEKNGTDMTTKVHDMVSHMEKVPSFKQGIGQKIADKNGTDITTNILDMIFYMEPKTTEELGKIIKSFKPHIKSTTLATYIRGYLNYLNISWRIDEKKLIEMPWTKDKVAPLDDSDVVKKENTNKLKTITKEERQELMKETGVETGEMAGKQAEWSDEILTDHSAAEVVSVYGGKITKRKLGMLLKTTMMNNNEVERDQLKELVRLSKADAVRHARYAIKKGLLRLKNGKYVVKDGGQKLLAELQKEYDLDVPAPDAEPTEETQRKTVHVKKTKLRMRLLQNKLSKDVAKRYETHLYLERYEHILSALQKESGLTEQQILDRLTDIEKVTTSRNNLYAHLRYGCERRDLILENKQYRLMPNAKRELEKIRKRREKKETTSETIAEETKEQTMPETPMQQAKRAIKETYGVEIEDEKYQKLKNTLETAFGYKKSIKEFAESKAWSSHTAAAYCRYGVRMGEITPVGKSPDKTTTYALVKNVDKLARERKEIRIKSKSWVDGQKDARSENESKSYSIYEINKK